PAAERAQYQRRCRGCNPPSAVRLGSNRLFERPGKITLQIERSLESLLRVLRQTSPDNPFQRRSEVQRPRPPLQHRRNHARRALPLKCTLAAQRLVEHAAEAEQIAARIGLLALQLLRRHVMQGPENLSLAGQRGRQGGVALLKRTAAFGQAEVE